MAQKVIIDNSSVVSRQSVFVDDIVSLSVTTDIEPTYNWMALITEHQKINTVGNKIKLLTSASGNIHETNSIYTRAIGIIKLASTITQSNDITATLIKPNSFESHITEIVSVSASPRLIITDSAVLEESNTITANFTRYKAATIADYASNTIASLSSRTLASMATINLG